MSTRNDRKMPEKAICFKCKKSVDIKKTALCSTCNNRYELDCIGYPEQTYRLMDQESRKKWRCTTCIKNKKVSNTSYISNITSRKKLQASRSSPEPIVCKSTEKNQQSEAIQTTTLNMSELLDSHILSEYETSTESYDTPNKLSKSVDGTISETLTILEMKDTINDLTNKLDSTENELENTILENNNLRQQLNKLTTEIKMLKTLCHSPPIENNAVITRGRKQSLLHQTFSTPSTPLTRKTNVSDNESIEIVLLQQKIVGLLQELENTQEQLADFKKQIDAFKHCNNSNHQQSRVSKTCPQMTAWTREQQSELPSRILIFGSQQCVGLAAAMIKSRKNTQYERYQIISETKPNALSNQIIMNCRHTKLNPNDKLVICVGENDHNLNSILSQLRIVLDTFYNNMIIVLNVFKNENLDINNLNYRINNMCKSYKKCKFLEYDTTNTYGLCNKINYLIDYNDYSENYLNPRELIKKIASNKLSLKLKADIHKPKKGTIPFYFQSKSLTPQTLNLINPVNKTQKGTIPYYFPKIKRNSTFFLAQNNTSSNPEP